MHMVTTPAERDEVTAVLAIFDLDGTLVTGDSFVPFLVTYALRHRGRRALPALMSLPVELGLYASRLRSAAVAKERLLRSFLGGESEATIAEHAAWFFEHWVRRKLRPEVVRVLRAHQEVGHRVILLSASPDLYVRPIARELGIVEVVCTRVATTGGWCRGHLIGPNCKGDAKVALLQKVTGMEQAPAGSYAYGDSRSDLPILRWVEHGYLVMATRPWHRLWGVVGGAIRLQRV
ncbi:MAG: HAD family hydrolase [Isosphaeraceae bacterium]|nr:HAD family hydrolase [Isosphaeraceae bacterium]